MLQDRMLRLGRTVRRRRRRLGLTQEQLGSTHVTKSFISQMEQGATTPSLDTLFHIGDALKLSAPCLLAMSDPVIFAGAALDMAEAAFLLGGNGKSSPWLLVLEDAMPLSELPDSGLGSRWERYVGIQKLVQNKYKTAVTMLEAAASSRDPATWYWLGIAHERAGHSLQALRTWELVVGLGIEAVTGPAGSAGTSDMSDMVALDLIQALTWVKLVSVYERLGEPLEAERVRGELRAAIAASALGTDSSADCTLPNLPPEPEPPWDPFRDATWRRAGQFLARLIWTEAEAAWHRDHILNARSLARLVPPLASTTIF